MQKSRSDTNSTSVQPASSQNEECRHEAEQLLRNVQFAYKSCSKMYLLEEDGEHKPGNMLHKY